MKKILFFVLMLMLLFGSVTAVGAEELYGPEISPAEQGEVAGEASAPATDEGAAEGENEDMWFVQAKAWLGEHFSGLLVSISALLLALPKVGGVALLAKGLGALRSYIDDKKNPNSIYNVMARQGDAIVAFMNKMSPLLISLEASLTAIAEGKVTQDGMRSALLAVEESVELMAKEFNDLISISPEISQKVRTQMEEDFMAAKQHLHKTVREALGNDTANGKTDP